jgi:hypothetical protein
VYQSTSYSCLVSKQDNNCTIHGNILIGTANHASKHNTADWQRLIMKKGPNYLVHNTTPTQSLTNHILCSRCTIRPPPWMQASCSRHILAPASQSPHPLLSEPWATALKVWSASADRPRFASGLAAMMPDPNFSPPQEEDDEVPEDHGQEANSWLGRTCANSTCQTKFSEC